MEGGHSQILSAASGVNDLVNGSPVGAALGHAAARDFRRRSKRSSGRGQDVSSENLGGSKSNCVLLHCRYFHTQNDIEYIQYIELLHQIVILNEILMQPLGLSLEIECISAYPIW